MLTATIGEVFPNVMRDPIEDTNTLLVASDAALGQRLRAPAPALPPALRPRRSRRRPGSGPPLRGGDVYTDDKAPVEWLIDKSIVDYASGE